jgi:hypothetical protein
MHYQTIELRKSKPCIGAEISGVDLSKTLGNQQFQEAHDALAAIELQSAATSRTDQSVYVEIRGRLTARPAH